MQLEFIFYNSCTKYIKRGFFTAGSENFMRK